MKLDKKHPMNQSVLAHLSKPEQPRFNPELIILPHEHQDPYVEAGSHPDIVVRVWDVLGASLPTDCRAIVHGTPALVHPDAGVLFAMSYGMSYVIRVPDSAIDAAITRGCQTEQEWTGGGKTNIEEELGRGWLFGCFATEEKRWLADTYHALGTAA